MEIESGTNPGSSRHQGLLVQRRHESQAPAMEGVGEVAVEHLGADLEQEVRSASPLVRRQREVNGDRGETARSFRSRRDATRRAALSQIGKASSLPSVDDGLRAMVVARCER
jgi:hypothetical protein